MQDVPLLEGNGAHFLLFEQHIRRGISVEGEAPLAALVAGDEGERRVRLARAEDVLRADVLARKGVGKEVTEGILPQFGDDARGAAQPCRAHRDVGGRAARVLAEGICKLQDARLLRRKVDEHFPDRIKGVHGILLIPRPCGRGQPLDEFALQDGDLGDFDDDVADGREGRRTELEEHFVVALADGRVGGRVLEGDFLGADGDAVLTHEKAAVPIDGVEVVHIEVERDGRARLDLDAEGVVGVAGKHERVGLVA